MRLSASPVEVAHLEQGSFLFGCSILNSRSNVGRKTRKIVEAAVAIAAAPPTTQEKMFLARQLVQATLPHRDPGNVPIWLRSCGDVVLTIQQGYRFGTPCGYPFGAIPRLLMYWMTTEAVRSGQRRLELGDSLSAFIEEIGLNPNTGGGERGGPARVRAQMRRLLSASISFSRILKDDVRGGKGEANTQMQIAKETVFWWGSDNDEVDTDWQWGSYVVLDQDFFDAITASPVPLDMRALRAIQQSPLALDLYSLLTYQAFLAQKSGRPRFLSWRQLQNALGASYSDPRNFNRAARDELRNIGAVYPALRLGDRTDGIEILPESLPAVPR